MALSDGKSGPEGSRSLVGWVAGLSNFSIQYNYASASIAAAVMLSHWDATGEGLSPDYPQPMWAKQALLGVVFVGSVVGMLLMGYLGDLLGVRRALFLSNFLSVVGALGSALLSWGSPDTVWGVVAAFRFVLGVGVGGNYPLSASRASESCEPQEATSKAAKAFFWQGPGSLAPYALAMPLLRLPRVEGITSLQFRTLLGAGALPALAVLVASHQEATEEPAHLRGSAELSEALHHPRHWRTLVGTAGTWFLFDVAYYGTVIFSPRILMQVFGSRQSLEELSAHAVEFTCVGIAGTALGLMALPRLGAKALGTLGFVISALAFAVFALALSIWHDRQLLLLGLLCILNLALSFGPNVSTYVLPVTAFPPDVRSTFHGLSAAAAKVGAMVGTLLFPAVDRWFGIPAVMFTQAMLCAAGALVSHLCLEEAVPGHAPTPPRKEDPNEFELIRPIGVPSGVLGLLSYSQVDADAI